jgi:hypothetical protein
VASCGDDFARLRRAKSLAGLAEQVLQQRSDDENDDDPEGNLHGELVG